MSFNSFTTIELVCGKNNQTSSSKEIKNSLFPSLPFPLPLPLSLPLSFSPSLSLSLLPTGTPQSEDVLIAKDEEHPHYMFSSGLSNDGKTVLVYTSRDCNPEHLFSISTNFEVFFFFFFFFFFFSLSLSLFLSFPFFSFSSFSYPFFLLSFSLFIPPPPLFFPLGFRIRKG